MLVTRVLAVICVAGYAMQAPDLETVLSRASQYVQTYERALGMVIAREEYVQRVPIVTGLDVPGRSLPGDPWAGRWAASLPAEYRELRLLSDFLMVRLASEGDRWIGFRAVVEADGRPVRDRVERLQEVLEGSPETAIERWRKLAQESARYNIGGFARSTNVPTFALLVLRDEHRERFEFRRIGDERVESLNVWVIRYQERAGPTLITDRRRQEDVFAHGRLWVDPVDGRLVRTEVRTGDEDSEMRSEITVRYRPNAELGIWVPLDMKERYESRDGRHFEATASYSNFQQFKVSVETELVR